MQNQNIFSPVYLVIIAIILLTLGACRTANQDHGNSDNQAKEIIERSIQFHGGMKNYEQLKHFSFKKDFSLYKGDGSVEFNRLQFNDYYPSQSNYNILWEQEDKSYKNSQSSAQFSQEIDGIKNTSIDENKIKSAIDASVFTIFLPWKLLDNGTNFTYDGEMTLPDGNEVYVVKAVYNTSEHKNHTSTDIWWHYFDKESCRHEGYKVALHDHTSLVSNLDFQTINGFIFPKTRKSWRLNESNEKDYLRAEYDYKITKIDF